MDDVRGVSVWVKSAVPSGVIWRRTNIAQIRLYEKGNRHLIGSKFKLPWLLSLFQYTAVISNSSKWAFVSIPLEQLNPKAEGLKWITEKAASSCYVPNTGVLCASSGLFWGCWKEVSRRVERPLISDLTASMASGWVSRKPRSQKAAGPALHWNKHCSAQTFTWVSDKKNTTEFILYV